MEKTFTLDDNSYLPVNSREKKFSAADFTPGDHLIRNILNYSRALSVLKTRMGSVNLILN